MFIVGMSRFRSVDGSVVGSDEGKEDGDYNHRPDRSPECEPEGGCLELTTSSVLPLSSEHFYLTSAEKGFDTRQRN